MPDELSPEAQELIARIQAAQAVERIRTRCEALLFPVEPVPGAAPLALECDRCGLPWTDASGGARAGSKSTLLDNAKAAGWQERRRYGATRHYCPGCASAIAEREGIRKKGRR